MFAAIGRFVGAIVPEPMKRGVGMLVRVLGTAGRLAVRSWPWALVLIGVVAVIASTWRRRTRHRGRRPAGVGEAAFVELVEVLTPVGHARGPSETAAEFLRAVEVDEALADPVVRAAELVVRTYEQERFGPPGAKPTEADSLRARAAAAQVRQLVRRH